MDGAYALKEENPKKNSFFLTRLFFGWTIPLYRKGINKRLELDDLYKTLEENKSAKLGDELEKNWNAQITQHKEKPNKKPSLLRALIKTFFWNYSIYGLYYFFAIVVLRTPQPLILAWLIRQFEDATVLDDKLSLYLSASSLILISLITIFLFHHGTFGVGLIGMRMRIASSSLIYRKIIKLSRKARDEAAAGRIINILSNDVLRFDLVAAYIHFLWIIPIQLILVTYIMFSMMGVYCLVGIGAMILITIPLQTYLGKLSSYLRIKVAERCDIRVKHMNEIINGIQVIKMYGWEKPFEKLIYLLRAKEVRALTRSSYLRGFYASCNVFIERLTLFLTLIVYTLAGFRISAEIVFSFAQYFNILQLGLAILYPYAISIGAEAWVAIQRLEDILMLEEKETSTIEITSVEENKGVKFQNATASWVSNIPTLHEFNLTIPRGKLCAVIGPVGAGKSSLLQLLLGELPLKSGRIEVGGTISFSSQEPWLFAATVRRNILFGKPYEHRKYKQVSKVCALEKDFQQLAQSDRTHVGERGVSLSGGQRARINLARAVYRNADIYLLDDPLSAVDTHVGKHLFDKCILEYLGNKTRILVTHQLQYLKRADIIIVLNEGRIEAQGTFDELVKSNLDFTKLLAAADETPETTKNEEKELENKPRIDIERMRMSRRVSIMSIPESIYEATPLDEEMTDYEGTGPLKNYLGSVENWCFVMVVFICFFISMLLCTATDYFTSYWSTQEAFRYESQQNYTNSTNLRISSYIKEPLTYITYNTTSRISFEDIFDEINVNGRTFTIFKTNVAIYIYTILICSIIFFTIARAMLLFKMCMKSSTNLHKKMFNCLLKTPMRFFDTNPSGRVLNRFSKDMGAIDEILPRVIMDALAIFLVMIGILINVLASNYYMAIATFILGIAFLKLRTWYIASAKDIKHLEGIAKSPVFSHITSTISGLTTIRATHSEDPLIQEFDEHQDVHTSAWYFTIMCMVSFGLWLDIVSIIFIGIITFTFVGLAEFGIIANGSLVGLAISQSLMLTGMVQHGMRQTSEVVNQLTSVERVLEYTKLDTEGPFETSEDKRPKAKFASKGEIRFENLSLTYIEGEPAVLKNLTLTINPGEKIGIVGRTGAGKSSLINALFYLSPIEGQIFIDNVDTKTLGLTDLRQSISIIPQEPVLFSSSLRDNLDPFKEFDDKLIWEVLEEVELKDLATTLDMPVSEGGNNFSLGQRQLLCLGRALLRKNKILVLDEATANVDARTDALIQTTIRKKFKECTVLTIAHRLNTIMDSDRVLVMDFGSVAEFDHPHALLKIEDGQFLKMVQETGPSMTEQLKAIALQAWIKSHNQK